MHVMVKELAAYKGKSPHTPELVEALAFKDLDLSQEAVAGKGC